MRFEIKPIFGLITLFSNLAIGAGNEKISCDLAALNCSYRSGCSNALKAFLWQCHSNDNNENKENNDNNNENINICTEGCRQTLVGIVSTAEGEAMLNCECGDEKCQIVRARVEICRDSVLSTLNASSRISCNDAQWICRADAECAKALEYYALLCKNMFRGRECSDRCRNSLAILRRQRQAERLEHCLCSEKERNEEEFYCEDIKKNTRILCDNNDNNDNENNIMNNDIITVDHNEIVQVVSSSNVLRCPFFSGVHFLAPFLLCLITFIVSSHSCQKVLKII